MSSRREFLRVLGMGAVVAPAIAVKDVAAIGREKVDQLPPVQNGTVMTAEYMNAITERLNRISEVVL